MIYIEDIINTYISLFDFDKEEKDEVVTDLLDAIQMEFVKSLSDEEIRDLGQVDDEKDPKAVFVWVEKQGKTAELKEKINSAIKKTLESWAAAMAEDLSDQKKEGLKEKLKAMDQTIQGEIKSEE